MSASIWVKLYCNLTQTKFFWIDFHYIAAIVFSRPNKHTSTGRLYTYSLHHNVYNVMHVLHKDVAGIQELRQI